LDHQIFGFLFRIVAKPRAAGRARCTFSIKPPQTRTSAQAGNASQARENRSDNFFMFVTEEMHETNPRIAFRA
jgi:hypothetical protein